jgi:malonyl-CoA O-methyltransferase
MSRDAEAEFRLDTRRVRRAFDRAAAGYETRAVLQRTVEAHCLSRLDLVRLAPQSILDLGCGPGVAGRALLKRYRGAQVIGVDFAPAMLREARQRRRWFSAQRFVCADVQALPLAADSMDLVFSNLTVQWCNDPAAVLAEAWRVLRPGGLFMFTSLGPDTLKELRNAWRSVDGATHVSAFIDMHDLGDALGRSGFEQPVLDVERFCLTYPDVRALAVDLKAIGAGNVTAGRRRQLTGRAAWSAMEAAYEASRSDGRLPTTYEVIYAHAWKPLVPRRHDPDAPRPMTFHPPRRGRA